MVGVAVGLGNQSKGVLREVSKGTSFSYPNRGGCLPIAVRIELHLTSTLPRYNDNPSQEQSNAEKSYSDRTFPGHDGSCARFSPRPRTCEMGSVVGSVFRREKDLHASLAGDNCNRRIFNNANKLCRNRAIVLKEVRKVPWPQSAVTKLQVPYREGLALLEEKHGRTNGEPCKERTFVPTVA